MAQSAAFSFGFLPLPPSYSPRAIIPCGMPRYPPHSREPSAGDISPHLPHLHLNSSRRHPRLIHPHPNPIPPPIQNTTSGSLRTNRSSATCFPLSGKRSLAQSHPPQPRLLYGPPFRSNMPPSLVLVSSRRGWHSPQR